MNLHLLLGGLAAAAFVPAIAAGQPQPSAAGNGANASYTAGDPWAGAPKGIQAREDWLDHKIHSAMADGTMDNYQGRDALKQLGDIRKMDAADRAAGALSDQQTADIQGRLDAVHATLVKAIAHSEMRSF